MIGNKVKVIIDRPLGTFHPKHKDIFIQSIMAILKEYLHLMVKNKTRMC